MSGATGFDVCLIGCGDPPPADATPERVGGKASCLLRMAGAGLPVPPGFVIGTSVCREYLARGGQLPPGLRGAVQGALDRLGAAVQATFGGTRRPLLVSVRSGAPVSMPGMMDTLLNVGLCDRTHAALIRATGNPRLAWDCYRRLVQCFGEVVWRLPGALFEQAAGELLLREDVPDIAELDVAALAALTGRFQQLIRDHTGTMFPQDPYEQLLAAIEAVFQSWHSPRATEYRRLHQLDAGQGTAVTVQAMVYGNSGGDSGAGVAFSRDPSTGRRELFLDFLWNSQGEDVVSGRLPVGGSGIIVRRCPELFEALEQAAQRLEALFGDMQDFEFTIERGRLYLLQARSGKRTPWAALQIACDLVREGLIDPAKGLLRLATLDLGSICRLRVADTHVAEPLARGVPAGPGVASGLLAFDAEAVQSLVQRGRSAILVRPDIATVDLAGLAAAVGVLTAHGGRTSHAAVVARQMNKVCIVGCRDLEVHAERGVCRLGGQTWTAADLLSLDGHSGCVYAGQVDVVEERPVELLDEVRRWQTMAEP